MERGEHEPIERYDAKLLASLLSEDRMVCLAPGKIKCVRFIETGEVTMQSVSVGETEMHFRVPLREPIIEHQVATLRQLARQVESEGDDESRQYRHQRALEKSIESTEITDASYLAWQQEAIPEYIYRDVAVAMIKERGPIDPMETGPCGNCKGAQFFDSACSCTHGGIIFNDMTDDSQSVQLRKNGEASPDCKICDGTGHSINACPICEGSGTMNTYPRVIFVNHETGQKKEIVIDIASLIADGTTDLEHIFRTTYSTPDDQYAYRTMTVGLSGYVSALLHSIGINPEGAVSMNKYGVSRFDPRLLDRGDAMTSWRKTNGKVTTATRNYSRKPEGTPQQQIAIWQQSLARMFSGPTDINGRQATAGTTTYELRSRRAFASTLSELIKKVSEHGFGLGVNHSFIATGQTGPSFYILDKKDVPVRQLSSDYTLDDALDNATLRFDKLAQLGDL